jgi:putative phosphoribosyl transferase
MRFRDREEAGRSLGQALLPWRSTDPVVVALPRGGVPVAAEVAEALGAPLDVLVVRKLGLPMQPEVAMGAIGEGGVQVLNRQLLAELRVPRSALDEVVAREEAELARRVTCYRGGHDRVPVEGRTVVLVDDGLATGSSALAAIAVLRQAGAARVVLAVPVAPADTIREFRTVADDVVCLLEPRSFRAVGEWYERFGQVGDADVAHLLGRGRPLRRKEHSDRRQAVVRTSAGGRG